MGIFPYVLKLLQSSARELRPLLVFIWAKILAVDSVSGVGRPDGKTWSRTLDLGWTWSPESLLSGSSVSTVLSSRPGEGQRTQVLPVSAG